MTVVRPTDPNAGRIAVALWFVSSYGQAGEVRRPILAWLKAPSRGGKPLNIEKRRNPYLPPVEVYGINQLELGTQELEELDPMMQSAGLPQSAHRFVLTSRELALATSGAEPYHPRKPYQKEVDRHAIRFLRPAARQAIGLAMKLARVYARQRRKQASEIAIQFDTVGFENGERTSDAALGKGYCKIPVGCRKIGHSLLDELRNRRRR